MKGDAHMNRDETQTSSSKLPSEPPASRWKAAAKRIFVVGTYFIAAIGILAGLLSRVNPSLLVHILLVFLSYPLVIQAVVIIVVLICIALLAAAKQIQQALQTRQFQENVQIGAEAAVKNTALPPIQAIQRLFDRFTDLFERFVDRFPYNRPDPTHAPVSSTTSESPSGKSTQPPEAVHPLPSAIFIGREKERDWLVKRLNEHGRGNDTTVLYGISGIGKSALVDKAIEEVERDRFKGSVAHIQCHDMSDHFAVIRSTLESLTPNRSLPPILDLDVLRQISEQLLTDKERLIVLDGVEPAVKLEAVVYALRTSQHSAHILITTTSAPATQIAPADRQWHLEPLGTVQSEDGVQVDQALELFAQYAGKPSAKEFGADLPYAIKIVEALERHTYALQLMGIFVQLQPTILRGISIEVGTLRSGKVTPGLEGVLEPVWFALRAILKDLGEHNPEACRLLFALVVAFNNVDAGRLATRALGDALGLHNKDGAIYELLRRELMVSHDIADMPPGSDRHRLRIHTLLLGYVSNASEKPEWAETVVQGRNAAATFYAGYVRKYDHRDFKRDDQRILGPDEDAIIYSLDWAITNQQHENVVALAHGMRRFWLDRWRNDLTEKYMLAARDSATQLSDRARQERNTTEEQQLRGIAADLSFTLGRMYRRTGRLLQAEPLFLLDLTYRKQQRQYAEQAEAYHQLAQLERSRGNMRAGLNYCRKGLTVVERHLPRKGQSITHDATTLIEAKGLLIAQWGRIERSRGNLQRADMLFAQAFELFQQSGDVLEQGVALGYRGRIARVLGNLEQAAAYFEQSSALALQVHDVRGQGVISTQFGRIARIRGDLESAKRAFDEGHKLAQQVLDYPAVAVNLNYLGRIATAEGNTDKAKEYFTDALEIATKISDRLEVGVNLDYLGRIARQEGDLKLARRNFSDSLTILREVEDRRGQALVLAQMALLDIDRRRHLRARCKLWKSLSLIRRVKDQRSEGTILLYCGQLDVAIGDLKAARMRFDAALIRAQELGDVGGEAEAKRWLERVAAKRKDNA